MNYKIIISEKLPKVKTNSTRRNREHDNLFRPIDYNSNKAIGNQLNRSIDRLFIVRESSFPLPEVDELKKEEVKN